MVRYFDQPHLSQHLVGFDSIWAKKKMECDRRWERRDLTSFLGLICTLLQTLNTLVFIAIKFSKSFPQSVKEQSTVLFLPVYLASHAETFKKFVSLANLTLFPNAVFVYVNFFDKYKTSIAHHFRVMLKIINIYVWPCTFTPFGGLYVNWLSVSRYHPAIHFHQVLATPAVQSRYMYSVNHNEQSTILVSFAMLCGKPFRDAWSRQLNLKA